MKGAQEQSERDEVQYARTQLRAGSGPQRAPL